MNKNIQELSAGIFVLFGLALIVYMSITLGSLDFFGHNTYLLQAKFTSVNGLRPGNPIEMNGIKIGEVRSFTLDQENQLAIAGLEIDNDIKVYADAIASIKTAGLIGDRFVDIAPGGAEDPLKPGDFIIDTVSPIDITDLIGKIAFGSVDKNDKQE